ncbi:kinase-like protein, partial [Aspergillus steynii IBT 23096]
PTPQSTMPPEDRLGLRLANQIELKSVLGNDSLANSIYTGIDIQTKSVYAVKAFSKISSDRNGQRELRLHHIASEHRNVLQLVRIIDAPDCMYSVMEFSPEGDLFDNITAKSMYSGDDSLIKKAFIQILNAVRFCHAHKIYHFNIQPESILVANQGKTLKLSSFEFATTDYFSTAFNYKRNFYVSPESLRTDQGPDACYFSAPHDVWSLGVVLINLICGRNPWKLASVEDATYKAYLEGPGFLRTILPLSNDIMRFLNRVFESDASKRIGILELRDWVYRCPCFTVEP